MILHLTVPATSVPWRNNGNKLVFVHDLFHNCTKSIVVVFYWHEFGWRSAGEMVRWCSAQSKPSTKDFVFCAPQFLVQGTCPGGQFWKIETKAVLFCTEKFIEDWDLTPNNIESDSKCTDVLGKILFHKESKQQVRIDGDQVPKRSCNLEKHKIQNKNETCLKKHLGPSGPPPHQQKNIFGSRIWGFVHWPRVTTTPASVVWSGQQTVTEPHPLPWHWCHRSTSWHLN